MAFLYGLFIVLGIGLIYLFITRVVPELTKKEIKEEEEKGGDVKSLKEKYELAAQKIAEATALIEEISENSDAEIQELTDAIEKVKQVAKESNKKIKKLKELQEDESK